MFGKGLFYVCLVLALILIVENVAYKAGFGLLFIGQSSVSEIVIVSVLIGFGTGFGLKTLLLEKNNEHDEEY